VLRLISTLKRYQRIAPFYDLLDPPFEYRRYRRIRPLLFDGLSGRILDAGIGTGRNAPFYPRGANIVGIDSQPRDAGASCATMHAGKCAD
jgi:hypothetical protein